MNFHLCVVALLFIIISAAAMGQTAARSDTTALKELRSEISLLRLQLDSLKSAGPAESDQGDALDQLEERLEKRLTLLENKIDAISRATAPIVLNPRTTAFINFAGRVDNTTVYEKGGKEISNRPFLRTVEVEMNNPVDPYAEAVVILSVENEAGKDFAIDAEEAYGLIKRLPIIESAPLGVKMKVGKFRAPFGVNNKIHLHDLPWTTRPLVIGRYLGTEHGDFFEGGFNATGVDLDFFLPNPIPQTTLEMNASVVRAGELGLSRGLAGKQPGYIGHLTLSRDWSNEHLLILGGSIYREDGPPTTQLIGADVTYKWAPSENRESHSFVAGGEFFTGRHSSADSSGEVTTQTPYGWYGYLQWQASYWLYLGARYDWLKEPADDQRVSRSVAGYLSYYTTEFLRFRLGFERHLSDIPELDGITSGIFEINLVFGSHPTEPYWVNR